MSLTAVRSIGSRICPDPVLQSGRDVLLQVCSVGVCGSDIHYYTTGRIGSQVVTFPFVLGHEFSATVLKTGSDVRRVRPGDRVAVDPAISCGTCDQCLCGRPHTCRKLLFLGCPGQRAGCLCEQIVMPEDCCFPVRSSISANQAALIEPFSIAVYAVQLAALLPREKIGILGAGPIGLCVQAAARKAGASAVYVTEPLPERRKVALRMGADWVGDPAEDPAENIADREPLLLDAVFECSGEPAALDDGVRLLRPGGRLLMIGIPEVPRVSFDIETLRRGELTLQNVRRQNGCVQKAIDLLDQGGVSLDGLQTHAFPFEQTAEAFEWVAGKRDGVIKAMIHL